MLGESRSQLRSALGLADQGDVAAARLTLMKVFALLLHSQTSHLFMTNRTVGLQLFDENEEILLHVFGGTLPLCYDLGVYAPRGMAPSRLSMAFSQVDQLLKVYLPPICTIAVTIPRNTDVLQSITQHSLLVSRHC